MTTDPEDQLEKLTAATFLRVIDFLKFSEAKNGALVTFASAWTLGLTALILSDKQLQSDFRLAIVLSIPLFFAGMLFGLWSFLPKAKLASFTRLHSVRHDPNLLFFGDIALMSIDAFGEALRTRYRSQEGQAVSDEYFSDLCVQISVLSSIVMRKLRLFNRGLFCTGAALLILAIPSLRLALATGQSLLWG